MTDPNRLLTSGATEFERMLLGAAARERPTQSQRRRMQRALGLSQLGVLLMSAKALAGVASHSVVMAVAAASLVGGASTPRSVGHELRHPASPMQREASAPVAPTNVVAPETSQELIGPAAQRATSADAEAPASKSPSGARATNGQRKLPDLREEIALMDQARSALRNGAPSRAMSALDQYRVRFPQGSFGPEATVLRIEALEASGNHARAVTEAKGFLLRNPNSPHAERLRRIVGP